MERAKESDLPCIETETYFNVWVQWKDGPGGKHRCDTWEQVIQEAKSLASLGYDKYEIRIRKIATRTWRFVEQCPGDGCKGCDCCLAPSEGQEERRAT